MHIAIDDHSRLAYAEVLPDVPEVEREIEKAERETAADIEEAEDELVRELHGISDRLRVIETSLRARRA